MHEESSEAKYVASDIFISKKAFRKSFLVEFGHLYKMLFFIIGYCLLCPLITSFSEETDFEKAMGVLLFPLGFLIFIFFLVQIYFYHLAHIYWETEFTFYKDRIQIERPSSKIFHFSNLKSLKLSKKTVVAVFTTENGKRYFYFPFPSQIPESLKKILEKNV